MAINVWVSSITFSDGTKIELSEGDIVLFVGPNNAGKSVALREILTQLGSKPVGSGVVVVEIEIGQSGDFSELIAFIEQNMRKTESGNDPSYAGWGTFVRLSQANGDWHTAGTRGLQSVTQLLVQHVSVDGRLHVSNPPAPIAFAREPLSHPVHFLYRHEDIEAKFSRYFHQAFGQDLIVNRGAGSQIPLHCGSDPEKLPGEDRVSARYLQELEMVPHLSEQGDGMRSFVGVLLQSLVGEHSIVLIDEPEAFLHPPQALLLGRMLVTERPKGRQLLLATHSIDFMKGVIDASSENVRVIRLRRDGLLNRVRELDKRGIKELWSDPILRHSDVLHGLF